MENLSVALRASSKEDIEYAMTLERETANAPYVRQWFYERHLQSLEDPNEAHLIIICSRKNTPKGFAILIGLEDPDGCLQLKRIVIEEKSRGYGRDAIKAIKAFAFREVGCHRLWLEVVEGHHHAQKLYESEGFQREGFLREALKRGEEQVSLNVMSILSREYDC